MLVNSYPSPCWQMQDLLAMPYQEGSEQLLRVFADDAYFLEEASPLVGRVRSFALGVCLLIPLINTIVYVGLQVLFNQEQIPEEEVPSARDVLPSIDEGPQPEQELRIEDAQIEAELSVRDVLEQQLDSWVDLGEVGENRLEAKGRILRCFDRRSRTLSLSELGLTSLPNVFTQLRHVTMFEAYDNKLTELPEEITQLESLVHLDVHENQLVRFPNGIQYLQNLRRLDLSYNQLTSLDGLNVGALRYVDISHNQIQRLPGWRSHLREDCFTSLEGNPFQNADYKALLQSISLIGVVVPEG